MDYAELLERVRKTESAVPAERAVPAVLTALGEHLPAGEARYLAVHLPSELRAYIRRRDLDAATPLPITAPDPATEFAHEVGSRCGCDDARAGEVVRSVLAALDQAVPHGVMYKVRASVGKLA